ncbi:MAG: carboxylesterase family protein [Saprospiraceae bacterium]
MKKIYLLFLLCGVFSMNAQNPACDGVRYKTEVFAGFTKKTVQYATTTDYFGMPMTLSMDVYEPQGDTASARPVVVLAHGGAFVFGDRTQMDPFCQILARQGYVAVTIQYRLYPFFILGLPDSIKIMDAAFKAMGDFKAAVRFVREDRSGANLLRSDTAHIFGGGVSAGSIAALHAGYMGSDDNIPAFLQTIINNNGGFEGASGSANNKGFSSAFDAMLNMSGGLYRAKWLDANDIPLVSYHGTADDVVFYNTGLAAGIAYLEGSGLIDPQAQLVNVFSRLITVPGGGHENIYNDPLYASILDSALQTGIAMMESLTCAMVSTDQPEVLPLREWFVSPNPASSVAQLVFEEPFSGDLSVHDQFGHLVIQKTLRHQSTEQIPCADLPNGTYWVSTSNSKGNKSVQKIVVLH